MFSDRKPSLEITYIGSDAPGAQTKNSIDDGDSVVLNLLNESVLIRDIRTIAPGKFAGIVYGFEPSQAAEYGGLKVDDIVNFSDYHVLLCSGA